MIDRSRDYEIRETDGSERIYSEQPFGELRVVSIWARSKARVNSISNDDEEEKKSGMIISRSGIPQIFIYFNSPSTGRQQAWSPPVEGLRKELLLLS